VQKQIANAPKQVNPKGNVPVNPKKPLDSQVNRKGNPKANRKVNPKGSNPKVPLDPKVNHQPILVQNQGNQNGGFSAEPPRVSNVSSQKQAGVKGTAKNSNSKQEFRVKTPVSNSPAKNDIPKVPKKFKRKSKGSGLGGEAKGKGK
jgi:hypothetical protein